MDCPDLLYHQDKWLHFYLQKESVVDLPKPEIN